MTLPTSEPKDVISITGDDLPSIDSITQLVQDDSAGAINFFLGTTRNTFQGKQVVRLDYEAYHDMSVKMLQVIIKEARAKWTLQHIAIYHRTGTVPVGQTSVIIAVSSIHRAESIHATEYLIDQLKERCPIWKKEVYTDGSVWKGACEGCRSQRHGKE